MSNEVSLDKLVSIVVREVVKELERSNIKVVHSVNLDVSFSSGNVKKSIGLRIKKEKIDMSSYKSPVLTENHIKRLHELTGEIVIPENTIITPKARQMLKLKNVVVNYE